MPLVLLAPMLPPMYFVLGLGDVAKLVHLLDGVGADTIGMESRVGGYIILKVKVVNCLIQPLNFFFLVSITLAGKPQNHQTYLHNKREIRRA